MPRSVEVYVTASGGRSRDAADWEAEVTSLTRTSSRSTLSSCCYFYTEACRSLWRDASASMPLLEILKCRMKHEFTYSSCCYFYTEACRSLWRDASASMPLLEILKCRMKHEFTYSSCCYFYTEACRSLWQDASASMLLLKVIVEWSMNLHYLHYTLFLPLGLQISVTSFLSIYATSENVCRMKHEFKPILL